MSKTSSILECERSRLQRWYQGLLLPASYRKVGWVLVILALVFLFGVRFVLPEPGLNLTMGSKVLLFGMLLLAISREKIEDEMIVQLRAQAFAFAFICGVIYTLVQPLINWGVDALLNKEDAGYEEISSFLVLWFMLVVYLCSFYLLKRAR